jgi:hypothetical protein
MELCHRVDNERSNVIVVNNAPGCPHVHLPNSKILIRDLLFKQMCNGQNAV